MKSFSFIVLLLIVVLTGGCASVTYQTLDVMPEVKEDIGLIYFYRDKAFFGGAISYYIYDGEVKIGALKNGTFFFHETVPGEHTYCGKTESKSCITLSVEAGKTYYVKGDVNIGFFVGRPELNIMPQEVGQHSIKSLRYAIINDTSS